MTDASAERVRGLKGSAAAAAVTAILLAACSGGVGDDAKARTQAQTALDNWTAAIGTASAPPVVPVGELTGQIGDWELAVGDNNKRALMAGRIVTTAELPGAARTDGVVTWPDGSTTTVPVMSAQDAIVAIERTASTTCADCTDLIATQATLVSAQAQTTRGPATVPTWQFTIEGTAVMVTRIALADQVSVPQLDWDPSFSSIGLHIDAASGSVGGTDVVVSFIGAPDPGGRPCGEDYSTAVVEADLAFVVIVTRHGGFTLGGCTAVGAKRTATASLASPLGARALLNVDDGQPVAMVVAP